MAFFPGVGGVKLPPFWVISSGHLEGAGTSVLIWQHKMIFESQRLMAIEGCIGLHSLYYMVNLGVLKIRVS